MKDFKGWDFQTALQKITPGFFVCCLTLIFKLKPQESTCVGCCLENLADYVE